jgi:hypothetical protein
MRAVIGELARHFLPEEAGKLGCFTANRLAGPYMQRKDK